VPSGVYPEVGARIMSLQDPLAKMGKTGSSEQGTIYLLDEPDAVMKKFKTAVTDSGREVRRADDKPGISNLIDIMSVATGRAPEAIEAEYGEAGYGTFKTAVGEAVVELLGPIRAQYAKLRADEASCCGCSGTERRRRTPRRRRRWCGCTRRWDSCGCRGDACVARGRRTRRPYSPTSRRSASTSSRRSGRHSPTSTPRRSSPA